VTINFNYLYVDKSIKEASNMKNAQEIRKERAEKRASEQFKKNENIETMELLILDKFREIEITTVVIWEHEGFFVIDEDLTDIPFDKECESALYKDFNSEEGYHADYLKMFGEKIGLEISIIE
jgi:hypothetical protein